MSSRGVPGDGMVIERSGVSGATIAWRYAMFAALTMAANLGVQALLSAALPPTELAFAASMAAGLARKTTSRSSTTRALATIASRARIA